MKPLQARATLGVRLLGLALVVVGLWQLLSNLIDTFYAFEPAYFLYYVTQQLLRPLVALALGALLLLVSRPLGRRLARHLDSPS